MPQRRTCSRAGCRRDATAAIHWRNPRIHAGDRRKTWLACDEHLDHLRDFLAARAFPLEVVPVEPAPTEPALSEPALAERALTEPGEDGPDPGESGGR